MATPVLQRIDAAASNVTLTTVARYVQGLCGENVSAWARSSTGATGAADQSDTAFEGVCCSGVPHGCAVRTRTSSWSYVGGGPPCVTDRRCTEEATSDGQ